ncbi:MAG: response regulator [Acetivibrionales bacterium]
MHKVIIVDDEHLIRKRLKYGFNWGELGYELAGEASNGLEAINLIEEVSPDVAIVDIAMPNLNGLELAKVLRSKGNNIKIILLTGHSKFEYAREALAEHVYYYMLKPIDEDEFIKILKELAVHLDDECSKKRHIQNMENQVNKARFLLDGDFFHKFFCSDRQSIGDEKNYIKLEEFNIDLNSSNFILLIEIGRLINYVDDGMLSEGFSQIRDIIQNTFKNKEGYEIAYDIYCGYIIAIINSQKMGFPYDRSTIAKYLGEAVTLMEERFNSHALIGFGSAYSGIEGIMDSFHEAKYALKNRLVLKGRKVLDYESIRPYIGRKYRIGLDTISELRMAMSIHDFSKASRIINKVFDELSIKHILYDEILEAVKQLVKVAEELASDSGIDIHDIMGEYADADIVVKEANTVNEIGIWYTGFVEALFDRRKSLLKKGRNVELVQKVQEYILQNYSDTELSLGKIASDLYIAATYISSTFKQVSGISLVQYITKVRLEKAKELLSGGIADIKIVAQQAGYNDEYYFSRCFKKYYGISPSNYAKIKIQEGFNS